MVGMAEMGAPISLDGVAVHPDCWCLCLCYLHFAPENPEDGEMYLLVPAHPGCPGHSTQSRKMVVCCVFLDPIPTWLLKKCAFLLVPTIAHMLTIHSPLVTFIPFSKNLLSLHCLRNRLF